jgi:hypothetical protein
VQAKEEDPDEIEEEEEDCDDEEASQETAMFHSRTVAHKAAVNRLRCMPQQPGIVATWGENSVVSILNLIKTVTLLSEQEAKGNAKSSKPIQVCCADGIVYHVGACILIHVRGRLVDLNFHRVKMVYDVWCILRCCCNTE